MQPKLIRTCALLLTLFIHTALWAQWQPLYPLHAGFTDVFFVSQSQGYVVGIDDYVRPALYKTVNSGKNWDRIALPAEMYSSLRKITFTTKDTGYILATEGGVLRTVNGGATWSVFSFPVTTSDTYTDLVFTSRKTGYVCSQSGVVLKTTNAGLSWEKLKTPPVDTYHYTSCIGFVNDSTGYLVNDINLYKTTDGGATWLGPVQLNDRISALTVVDSHTVYAYSSFATYRSDDGGTTWQFASWLSAGCASFFTAAKGFLFNDYSEIYKTDDSCKTVRRVYHSDHPFSWSGVHFYDSTFGCAVGGNAIVVTQDGGDTWTTQNLVPFQDAFRDIYFPNDSDGLVIGDWEGVIRTNDTGRSWFLEEASVNRSDKYRLSFTPTRDTGLLEVSNSYTYITYDGGNSFSQNELWRPPFIGHLSGQAYFLFDSKNIFSVGIDGGTTTVGIAHTTDGGATWQKYTPSFSNALLDITFLDKKIGYACGIAGKIVKTIDGGATWQEQTTFVNNDLTHLFFTDSSSGFAYGNQGTIVKTTNGGQTWTQVSSPTGFPIIALRLINDTLGFAFSSIGDILKTTDGGNTWRLMNNTSRDGQTWLNKAVFKNDSTVFAIGPKMIYSLNLNSLTVPDVITAIPDVRPVAENAIQLYPNPTHTVLQISLGKLTFVRKVEIYDLQGHLLRQTAYSGVPVSRCSENVTGLTVGFYIIVITDKNHNHFTKPFLKN